MESMRAVTAHEDCLADDELVYRNTKYELRQWLTRPVSK